MGTGQLLAVRRLSLGSCTTIDLSLLTFHKRPRLAIANETGSLPVAKGEPGTGAKAPVELILYAEMLSSPRFAT